MVNKKAKTKTRTKTVNTLKDDVIKTAQKLADTTTGKKVKEVGKAVENTLDKLIVESERNVKETVKSIKKSTIKNEVYIEYCGNQISVEELKKRCYKKIEDHMDITTIKSINLYYKVEDGKVYCVVNENKTIELDI